MKGQELFSQYVIGGVPQEYTPAQILDAMCETPSLAGAEGGTIIDEVVDPVLTPLDVDNDRIDRYMALVSYAEKKMSLAFAGTYTRVRLLSSILDSLWRKGHFRLGDISIKADWQWDTAPVGASSAFYESVQSVADFMDSLGIKLSSYSFCRSEESSVTFEPALSRDTEDSDDIFVKEAFRSEHPAMEKKRACPSTFVKDPGSWIVYVPFETCDYRLGGSLLAQTLGLGGGVVLQLGDADYFMDCFEVVRELVEDGIVLAGATVSEGGLYKALKGMTEDETDIDADLSGLVSSYEESNVVRLLFAEVPGVLLQIKDSDFDYLDAELLLQDVAYFPLGHPVEGGGRISVRASAKSSIQNILDSLIQNAEGED